MRAHVDYFVEHTCRVAVNHITDHSVIKIGTPYDVGDGPKVASDIGIFIDGSPTDRAAFLRHMAEQLTAAADALDAERAEATR